MQNGSNLFLRTRRKSYHVRNGLFDKKKVELSCEAFRLEQEWWFSSFEALEHVGPFMMHYCLITKFRVFWNIQYQSWIILIFSVRNYLELPRVILNVWYWSLSLEFVLLTSTVLQNNQKKSWTIRIDLQCCELVLTISTVVQNSQEKSWMFRIDLECCELVLTISTVIQNSQEKSWIFRIDPKCLGLILNVLGLFVWFFSVLDWAWILEVDL